MQPETNAVNTNQALLHARSRIGQLHHIFTEPANSQLSGEQVPGGHRRVCESMSGLAAALSPRERSILELIGQGQSNEEIARVLCIAPETVKSQSKTCLQCSVWNGEHTQYIKNEAWVDE